ncbi:hypothetical protein [Pseudomonas caspiana]|uniref:Uncharacterized protein n=1 Tax=Pseudomonas caspiana TaxID=1451454 RepID=A0A1Y3NXY9_9PSED|nr:hypothetical protein [Pseudomonas caspiana]OUM72449.1 hypothetical protein AUC60_17900 [Pseudomonas caspiana]
MTFKLLGKTTDLKSGAHVIYCQASPDKYLDIVGERFGEFSIQRKRETHRAYKRLKTDIIAGSLLPSITLSVRHHLVKDIASHFHDNSKLEELLSGNDVVDILDGLQRTFILSDIKSEGVGFKENQELLLEFWLEPEMSKLIYRMIVLNSGQKAMSMRHQVELLFLSLKETIVEKVPGIEIISEKDAKRRTQANKYSLSNIASSYHAFITAQHETEKENLVAQRLIDEDAFDSTEQELTEQFEDYLTYLRIFCKLDELCWIRYSQLDLDSIFEGEDDSESIFKRRSYEEAFTWLGSENVMLAFFGATAQYLNSGKRDRINSALASLIKDAENNDVVDPLGIVSFNRVKSGLNARKTNVGFATRKLIATGFKEFFREDGDVKLNKCWPSAAE